MNDPTVNEVIPHFDDSPPESSEDESDDYSLFIISQDQNKDLD